MGHDLHADPELGHARRLSDSGVGPGSRLLCRRCERLDADPISIAMSVEIKLLSSSLMSARSWRSLRNKLVAVIGVSVAAEIGCARIGGSRTGAAARRLYGHQRRLGDARAHAWRGGARACARLPGGLRLQDPCVSNSASSSRAPSVGAIRAGRCRHGVARAGCLTVGVVIFHVLSARGSGILDTSGNGLARCPTCRARSAASTT